MTDDEKKVVDLRSHKLEKRAKVDDQTMDKTWQALRDVWSAYANEVNSRQQVAGEFCLSGEPSAVFSVLIDKLVAMAQTTKIEDDEILEILVELALVRCEPKGRLYQLLHKVSNLLRYGDEDAWEKMLRKMHAEGKLTDEQLAFELEEL